jgi:thiosulfate/3-mercaptopyruvate sulfurtransferase
MLRLLQKRREKIKPDSTSGVLILSRKIKVNIILILSLFLTGICTLQSFAGKVELLMTPAMVSSIPEHQRVVVDTRSSWKFLISHIPGAINLGNWQEFTHTVNGVKGFLNEDKSFIANKLGPLGVSSDKTIVIYGEPNDPWRTDGRFFWMFERYGFQKVGLLDGGLDSWKQAGKKIQRGSQHSTLQSNLNAKNINLNNQVIADKQLIIKVLLDEKFKIIDNRIRKEFDGTTPYGSPRGGHIPNAIHIHWPEFFQTNGNLKTLSALNSLLDKNGIRSNQEIIVYCTGGVRSAMAYFVFRYMGYKVRNYDGSWWDWSMSSLPIEVNG